LHKIDGISLNWRKIVGGNVSCAIAPLPTMYPVDSNAAIDVRDISRPTVEYTFFLENFV
jgi:hypothetical protein